MFVIEQPIPPAPAADSAANVLAEWNAELKYMFEKQAGVERFDLIQTFYSCKQEEGKPVAAYVLKMKGYLDQLECLGNVLPQDLSVGLILNGFTSEFVRFVRNYNMHNMGKTIGELHAILIEYEKCKGKANGKGKDKQVNIPKPKNPKPTAKEHPAKDDTCHHCKEVGHWKRNCLIYLVELLKKKKQVSTASFSSIFTIELFSFPNKSWVYDTGCGTHICITKQGLRGARKLEQGALYLYVGNGVRAQVEAIGSFDLVLPNGLDYALESATRILNMVPTKKGCEVLVKQDIPEKLQQISVKCIFIGYPKETMGYYFYFPPENKIVVARYAEFFEKSLITQEVSGRTIDLKEIQEEDTLPSEITSEIPMEVEGFEPPQEEVIPIRRSERTHRAPTRLCLNVEAEEHSLGDLNEPTSYKAAMLDPESNKWLYATNAKMQSMIDNMVWVLVDLPHNCKTVGKETFSPVADIRAIRILISITAFYDYEIWQMDVKTAFLNSYLDEDIYMVQPEGFVDLKHPRKVCKLQRSFYGLKKASRSWNKRFDNIK
ncbi:retrotransposon protein, putative, ty1-copia subclass, partial [Tanacetum coccineum]